MISKRIIRKVIFEQLDDKEEWVDISPDDYIDLLTHVNGDGGYIKKFSEYRGKKIRITGDLNLSYNKLVENIDSIDLVDGDLDISYTRIKFFDKEKVKKTFRYYRSEMYIIELQKELDRKFKILDELREENAWDVENDDIVSNQTEALYDHIYKEGTVSEYESDNGETKLEDKYFIWNQDYDYYTYGRYYTWLGEHKHGSEWIVIPDDKIRDLVVEKVESDIEELGVNAFRDWVIDNNLDQKEVNNYLYDFWSDVVYYYPEDYNVKRNLTKEQEEYVEAFKKRIESLNKKLLDKSLSNEQIEEIESDISDFESLIEDEMENPKGDFDEGDMEDAIQSFVNDDSRDFLSFIDERGMDKNFIVQFLDMEGIADTIISHDGYGEYLNGYDGSDDEYSINGEWYHVMRHN